MKQLTPLPALIIIALLFIIGCNDSSPYDHQEHDIVSSGTGNGQENDLVVSPPPLTDGIFPCNDCHIDMEPNPQRRELVDMHDDIDAIFNHDSENRWCLDCHDINSRDSLRLASGKLLGFDESYKLCGQCHGDKLRDWKVGVHGKRTGQWNGKKQYLLCAHCHNPHAPRFQKIAPLPPPVRQEELNNHKMAEEPADSSEQEETTH